MDHEEKRKSLDVVRSFWDRSAREDARYAILGTPETLDPEHGEAFFDAKGVETAAHLSWFSHPGAAVLELGCGIGRIVRPLSRFCASITGVDVSQEMLEQGRVYNEGIDNVELVHTAGNELPGIADSSIDFLYSLFVLIHVDRRSAFRYLHEFRRVLGRDGIAYLQFHDLLLEPAFEKFLTVVDTDEPLEFYTQPEIRRLLRAADLDVLDLETGGEYMYLATVAGSAEDWVQRFHQDVELVDHSVQGLFAASEVRDDMSGEVCLRVRIASHRKSSLAVRVAIGEGDHGVDRSDLLEASAIVPLTDEVTTIRVCYEGRGQAPFIESDGPVWNGVGRVRENWPSGDATLHCGLLPSGCRWTPTTLEMFPNLFLSRKVRVAADTEA